MIVLHSFPGPQCWPDPPCKRMRSCRDGGTVPYLIVSLPSPEETSGEEYRPSSSPHETEPSLTCLRCEAPRVCCLFPVRLNHLQTLLEKDVSRPFQFGREKASAKLSQSSRGETEQSDRASLGSHPSPGTRLNANGVSVSGDLRVPRHQPALSWDTHWNGPCIWACVFVFAHGLWI